MRCAGLVEDQKWAGGEFKATVGNDVTRMGGMNSVSEFRPSQVAVGNRQDLVIPITGADLG